jgi:hypothetical protein
VLKWMGLKVYDYDGIHYTAKKLKKCIFCLFLSLCRTASQVELHQCP